jgi:signal transduction histidine kinase/ligand-binding sensor domain-containing protein
MFFGSSSTGLGVSPLKKCRADSAPKAERSNIPRWHFLCLLLFLSAVNSVWAVDPNSHLSQYAHTAWRTRDGVFSGTTNILTQTSDGYLWIGTTGGLLHFDGVRFVAWSAPAGKQLLSSDISALLGARDGSLWIGTHSGLSRWKDGNLINYADPIGLINDIQEDRNGTVWVSRANLDDDKGSLCEVVDTKLRCHGKSDGVPPLNDGPLLCDVQGNVWIGGSSMLTRWKPGSSRTYAIKGLESGGDFPGVQALANSPDGSLVVGMTRSGPNLGLQQFLDGVWKPFVARGLDGSKLEIDALFLDRENALWIGTSAEGLYRFYDGTADHFRGADGLTGEAVYGFYEDKEGDVWAVTSGGLDRFRDFQVTSFSTREGLKADAVQTVLASRNGTVWVGNFSTLDALHDRSISSIGRKEGLPGEHPSSLFEDHAGRLWVGVDSELSVYEKGKFTPIRRPDGSPVGRAVALAEDRDGDLWIESYAPPRSLLRIRDFKVVDDLRSPGMPFAASLTADPQGGIWLGLVSGDLARYRNGQLTTYNFDLGQSDSRVRRVEVRPDGTVLGATPIGVIGLRDGKKQTLSSRNGLPCDFIYSLISDQTGTLWLYTQCGLVAVASDDLQRWCEHPETVLKVRTFDVFDGAQPAIVFNQPSASLSPDGRLWFANGTLLQMVDPARIRGNSVPPPVHIEEVTADRKRYRPEPGLRLPPSPVELEIDYTALSVAIPEKVRFRYKLEGHDLDWQEPGTRRQAFYNDLRPGRYNFRVIACNNDGVWNDAGASLDFSVAPAWYQTNWFRVLCVVSGVFLAWLIYRLRVLQISRAVAARFDERLAERTRMARDLHDTFLQTIQGSKLVADDALDPSTDPMRMRRAMEQLSVWLGRATQEGRAALNSLRTATTQTNDLAEALRRVTEDGLIPSAMAVNFSVVGDAREMHPIVRDEIYRIGYEAIRNACMHSGASRLEVELVFTNDLALRVHDNGTGIDPAIADRGKDGHFGLQGMRERAARIGGKLTLVSSSSSGTEIKLVVPGGIICPRMPVRRSLLTRIRSLFR